MKKLVLLLLLPISLFAQNEANEIEASIKKVENSLSPNIIYNDSIPKWNIEVSMKEASVKGLSIAVIRDYKIDWAKAYGWADEEEQRKVNTATRFQAASISKSINSMGILKLVQQGKLDLEADINTYLKDWQFPYDSLAKNKKINTANLLSHSAGLDIHGFPGYKRSADIPTLQQILDGQKPVNTKPVRSLFEPGKQVKYSGGGTTISQQILTSITGMNYADFMQQEVLTPLGMLNSSYEQPPNDTSNLATGYYRNGKPVKGKFHVYPEQAAAGLWTTPTDLAKYIIECQLALEGRSRKVLSKEMMKKRMTPYIDSISALGVFINNYDGNFFFNHNGGNEAFLCTSYGSLKDGNGVVIMINGENFSIISQLLNSVAQVYDWKGFFKPEFRKLVTPPADSLKAYIGKYLLEKDTLTVIACETGLCIQQNGQPANGFKMLFSQDNSFSIAEQPNAKFMFLRNAEGKIDAMELKQAGGTFRVLKID